MLRSARSGLPGGGKAVLVLDQFEQWLHAKRAEQNTELVRALRHCDGGQLADAFLPELLEVGEDADREERQDEEDDAERVGLAVRGRQLAHDVGARR